MTRTTNRQQKRKKVLIVGAGASGLYKLPSTTTATLLIFNH